MRLQPILQFIEALQLVMIIVYCSLSQSICSSLAVTVFLLDVTLILNKFYTSKKDTAELEQPLYGKRQSKVFEPLQLRKYLWILFLLANITLLVFKAIYFISGNVSLSPNWQVAWEVDSYAAAFAPAVLIPIGIPLAFLRDQNKKIVKFLKPTDQILILPVYFTLVMLLVLIQIFNTSMLGLLLVLVLIVLVGRRRWGFSEGRAEICIIQLVIGIYIVMAFFSSMSIVDFQKIEFYGLQCLKHYPGNDQWSIPSNKGYFFCLLLGFMVANFINSLFGYQKMHSLIQNYDIKKEDREIEQVLSDVPEDVHNKSKYENLHKITRMELKGKNSYGSELEMEHFDPQRASVLYQRSSQPLQPIPQQAQSLPSNLNDLPFEFKGPYLEGPYPEGHRPSVHKRSSILSRANYRTDRVQSNPISNRVNMRRQNKSFMNVSLTQQQKKKGCLQWVSNSLRRVLQILTSIQLNFRLTQLMTIIIIQRYNTIYSMILIVWLVTSSIYTKAIFLKYSIMFVVFPLAITNYITCFLYNIPDNPAEGMDCGTQPCSIYGFEKFNNFFWDIIIFDIYIFFIVSFIKHSNLQELTGMLLEDKLRQSALRSKKRSEISYWAILAAIIFKYSHLITLVLLYWVGYEAPTLLHLTLIVTFLVFYAFGSKIILKEKKNSRGRPIQVLTTFTEQYWFVIIILVGVGILAKYIYFLFFSEYDDAWIQPVGISEKYDVVFNFSFKQCRSNTTPLFWVLILSSLQLAITRSSIYLHYSYSILSILSQKAPFSKHQQNFKVFINVIQAFYYKSLFAVGAIIVMVCDFRWSINGIIIGSLVSFGLLFGFGIGRLWIGVMWVNIIHIFFNYFVMFLAYPAVQDMLGTELAQSIEKYSLMMGSFEVTQGALHELFLQSIIIFVVSVSCSQLYLLLSEITKNQNQEFKMVIPANDPIAQVHQIMQNGSGIELNQQLDDNQMEFANTTKKAQMQAIRQLWYMDLFANYRILNKLWQILQFLFLDISLLFVILSSLYFKLSVSMLVFLVIYLTYYFVVFNQIHKVYMSYGFYGHLDHHMNRLDDKIVRIKDQRNQHIFVSEDNFQQFKITFSLVSSKMDDIKLKHKKYLWLASSIVTFICLVSTYSSQFLVSNYCDKYCLDSDIVFMFQKILFILGLSTSHKYSLWRSIYFYFFMVLINMIQRCANSFRTNKQKQKGNQELKEGLNYDMAYKGNHQIEDYLEQEMKITQQLNHVSQDDIVSESYEPLRKSTAQLRSRHSRPPSGYPDTIRNVNLVCFNRINEANMKIKMLFGLLSALLRLYILMLMLNSYAKSNIFSWIYLIAALVYWNMSVKFEMVESINKIAIAILIIQYALLLFNINQIDASFYDPQYAPYSLVAKIPNISPTLLSYFAFGGEGNDDFRNSISTNASFIINSLIIFATQYYFRLFALICEYTILSFISIKNFYQYTYDYLKDIRVGESVYLNAHAFKTRTYIIISKIYQLGTVNSFLLLSAMILLIIDGFNSYVSVLLLIISSIYFYLAMFSKSRSDEKVVDKYTYKYFMFYKVVTFTQFIVVTIFNIPILCSASPEAVVPDYVCDQIRSLSVFGELVLLFFVQMWLDLVASQQFRRFSSIYYTNSFYKETLMAKCHTYKINDKKIEQLFTNYQSVMHFEVEVESALKSLEEWYIIMKKHEEYKQLKKEEFGYFLNKQQYLFQNTIQKDQEQNNPFLKLLKSQINHALYTNTSDLIMEIRFHNSRILSDMEVSFQEYVLEKLETPIQRCKELDQYYESLYLDIMCGNFKKVMRDQIAKLGDIKEEPSQVVVPQILNFKVKRSQLSIPEVIFYFILSKFDSILTFSILIYYLVNPALLSLPIIILMFSFEIISEYKVKNFVLLYILVIVLVGQLTDIFFQGQTIPHVYTYFFSNSGELEEISTGYLNFLFIMVLINQIIRKSIGFSKVYPTEIENEHQAIIRLVLDYQSPQSKSLYNVLQERDLLEVQPLEEQLDQETLDADSTQDAYINRMQSQVNPYLVYSDAIAQDPKLILDNSIPGFFESLYIQKPGTDLYPYIASVQIFIALYLILFYPVMLNRKGSGLNDTLRFYRFSADMIIIILIHVSTIIVERWVTLLKYKQGKKELIKYIETMIILCMVCLFCFWYAPFGGSIVEYSYYSPPALRIFMFIEMIYFVLSTKQIAFGYEKYKRINSLIHKSTVTNQTIMSVFTAVPFLQQLKLIMDWTFAKTSLSLGGWTKHFNIYLMAFNALRNAQGIKATKVGQRVPTVTKVLMGWFGFLLILLLIFGPMIIFSGLNPASQANLVVSGTLEIGLSIVDGNYFPFYSTAHFSSKPQPVSWSQYQQQNFSQVPALQGIKQSQIASEFQVVSYLPYSDNSWQISSPNFNNINSAINASIVSMSNNQTPPYQFQIQVNYELNRDVTETVSTPAEFVYPFVDNYQYLNLSQLISLNNTINLCNTPTILPNFYVSLLRIDTEGSVYKARPIFFYPPNGSSIPGWTYPVELQLMCDESPDGTTVNATKLYWSASMLQGQGLGLYILCDKYQKLSFGLSFIGLYTSVIFVVASFIRKFFTGDISMIPYNMNPKPESLLSICKAIYIMQMRGNLRAEYLLYYQLIDIMRSPEIIKFMCGSFTKEIRQNDKIRLKAQQDAKMIKED